MCDHLTWLAIWIMHDGRWVAVEQEERLAVIHKRRQAAAALKIQHQVRRRHERWLAREAQRRKEEREGFEARIAEWKGKSMELELRVAEAESQVQSLSSKLTAAEARAAYVLPCCLAVVLTVML